MYAQHVGISGSAIVIVCTLCSPIEKSVTPISSVRTNDVVTYTIIATNNNLITDTDHLILTDTLPVSVTFGQWIDQPPDGILQADNAITWTGILSAGESISLTFTATNTNSSGNIVTNIAYYNNTWETDSAAATFTVSPISYTLTISSSGNGNGIVTPTTGIYTYPFGTVVTSTASANIGSTFTGWSGECSSTGTCITTMTSDKSITATFALNIYTLTLATAGNGSGVITPTAGTYPFTYATVITLEAAPNFGSTFTGWSGDAGCAAGPVTMDADKACAATFITHHSYLPIIFK